MPQLLNENEVSYYLGTKHIYPKVEGGGSAESFIYNLDLSSLIPEGESYLMPDVYYDSEEDSEESIDLFDTINAAYKTGKEVYIKIKAPVDIVDTYTILLLQYTNSNEYEDTYFFEGVGAVNEYFYSYSLYVGKFIDSEEYHKAYSFRYFEMYSKSIGGTPIEYIYVTDPAYNLLEPNKYYVFVDYVTPITIYLSPGSSNTVDEYHFAFYCLDTAISLSMPNDIIWPKGNPLVIEPYTSYEINIINNRATWTSWEIPNYEP